MSDSSDHLITLGKQPQDLPCRHQISEKPGGNAVLEWQSWRLRRLFQILPTAISWILPEIQLWPCTGVFFALSWSLDSALSSRIIWIEHAVSSSVCPWRALARPSVLIGCPCHHAAALSWDSGPGSPSFQAIPTTQHTTSKPQSLACQRTLTWSSPVNWHVAPKTWCWQVGDIYKMLQPHNMRADSALTELFVNWGQKESWRLDFRKQRDCGAMCQIML